MTLKLDNVTKTAILKMVEKKADIDWAPIKDYAWKGGLGGLGVGAVKSLFDDEEDSKQRGKNTLNNMLTYGGLGLAGGAGLAGAQQLTGIGYDPKSNSNPTVEQKMLQSGAAGISKAAPLTGAAIGTGAGMYSDARNKINADAAIKAMDDPDVLKRLNTDTAAGNFAEHNKYMQNFKGTGMGESATRGVTNAMDTLKGSIDHKDLQTYLDFAKSGKLGPGGMADVKRIQDFMAANPAHRRTIEGLLDRMDGSSAAKSPLAAQTEGNWFTKPMRTMDEAIANRTLRKGQGFVSGAGRLASSGAVKGGVGGYLAGLTAKQIADLYNIIAAKATVGNNGTPVQ
jgi:hypothetical protein